MIEILDEDLFQIINLFINKKVVIITGAGISVSSGIPDFRSKTGIFKDIKKKYKINGEDLFSFKFSLDERTREIYLDYICELKTLVDSSRPSYTHNFFKYLSKISQLRVYTQNIDSLEEKAGLGLENLVYLHGNLKYLKCLYCGDTSEFTDPEIIKSSPTCSNCKVSNIRLRNVPRYLHTNIIHYHQDHPDSDLISDCIKKDSDCDLLIVVGTSLNVFGVRNMVKYFKKICSTRIFVNKEDCKSSLRKYFTHFYKGTSDNFFKLVKKEITNYDIDISLQDISLQDIENSSGINKDETGLKKLSEKNIQKNMKRLSLTKEEIVNNFLLLTKK
ncbi:NAD-dependent protein deacetlyase [Vairimorpha necatrix]|uniref:NAD-dependent protein deacetlyase n=1 Tax=Vairimorpha necatrix TaxID=6039 RepID=A0AAX4JG04_9MICR